MLVKHYGRSLIERGKRHEIAVGHTGFGKLQVKEDKEGNITVFKECLDCIKEKKQVNKANQQLSTITN